MKHLSIVFAIVTSLLMAPAVGAQSGYDLFQKALAAERADGNLRAAIQLYERVVKDFAGDRALAARALVRIAECYEKLGQRDAAKVYERIVKEFADQAESVTVARARLSALAAPAIAAGPTARELWSDSSVDVLGTPSADGRLLSFTDWETGDLAVRDLADGKSRRVTNTGGWLVSGDFAEYSVMAPDGRQIATAWFTDKGTNPSATRCACTYDLRVVQIAGTDAGKARVILSSPQLQWIRPTAWTADAKRLVVVRVDKDGPFEIGLVDVGTGAYRTLKGLGQNNPDTVALSPDDRFIAYDKPANAERPVRDVAVMSIEGRDEVTVASAQSHDHSPVWSADGRHLLFLSDRTGSDAVWRLPMNSGQAAGAPTLVMAGLGNGSGLIASARNGTLLYWTGGGAGNIFFADLDERLNIKGAPVIGIEQFQNANFAPVWSPDGKFLAYLSRRGSGPPTDANLIVVHSMETGENRDVPTRIPAVDRVSWFPDGRSLLVAARDSERRGLVYHRVNVATGAADVVHRITTQGIVFRRPQVSPDGTEIYFVDRLPGGERLPSGDETPMRLLRKNLATQAVIELKQLDGRDNYFTQFSLSPDGKSVAFTQFESAGRASVLSVIATTGGPARELMRETNTTGTRYSGIEWTPDGAHLLVARPGVNGAPIALWKVPVNGGTAESTGISRGGMIRNPTMNPRTGKLAFAADVAGAGRRLWALENFLAR